MVGSLIRRWRNAQKLYGHFEGRALHSRAWSPNILQPARNRMVGSPRTRSSISQGQARLRRRSGSARFQHGGDCILQWRTFRRIVWPTCRCNGCEPAGLSNPYATCVRSLDSPWPSLLLPGSAGCQPAAFGSLPNAFGNANSDACAKLFAASCRELQAPAIARCSPHLDARVTRDRPCSPA